MARYSFKLPDIGEGTAEAEITAWHVKVGDSVDEDQVLLDVMTDKATLEVPSPVAGRIVALHGTAGEKRAVGSELVVLETDASVAEAAPPPGEVSEPPPPAIAPAPPSVRAEPPRPPAAEPRPAESRPPPVARARDERPIASPAVRRRAWDEGIELQFVAGTGPGGRITHDDLEAHLAAPVRATPSGPRQRAGVEEIRIIGLRRRIAERMQDTKRRIPHFSYIEEVDVTALEALRRDLNTEGGGRAKLTLLPFLMRALVVALPGWPQINARFDDEAGVVHRHAPVHVGIATQTPGGLLVPVVRHAEALSLWQAAEEVARLSRAARDGQATKEELSGSTITITSLGPLGGLATTPVINSPEVAIVGVNKIVERPVVRDGAVVVRKMMNLSSSFDHRIVDGWDAAEFVQRVRALLEQPARLFLDDAR